MQMPVLAFQGPASRVQHLPVVADVALVAKRPHFPMPRFQHPDLHRQRRKEHRGKGTKTYGRNIYLRMIICDYM